MLGLVGAATIMGCLKYGASFSGFDDQDDPVLLFRLKDEDLLEVFFCSLLLECDLLAKKVPGRAPFSQHNIFRNWT